MCYIIAGDESRKRHLRLKKDLSHWVHLYNDSEVSACEAIINHSMETAT